MLQTALRDVPREEIDRTLSAARRNGVSRGAALERLARKHGWMRVTTGSGKRAWMRKAEWLAKPHTGYRYATGERKRKARLAVPKRRRQAIARLGAAARRG